ncbi:MAG: acyl-CoA thioesterase [Conexivisphaera sp.]
MEGRFSTTVSFDDTDCTGRVHFSKYSIWVDRAIQELFRTLGLRFLPDGRLRREATGEVVAFAIGEYWARMERPLGLGDRLEVVVRPSEVRSRVVVFEGSVLDSATGSEVARGRITMIHIDPSTGRSKEMPEWLRSLLAS